MQFKLATLATLLAASSSVIAAPAPDGSKITVAIQSITTVSGNLNTKLQSTTGPISIGQAILSGFKDIIGEKTKDIATFGLGGDVEGIVGSSTIPVDQQKSICQAMNTFVNVNQALLNTVIGEKGVLSSTFLTAPIAAVLRTDEGATDTLLFGTIGYVPECADDVRPQVQAMSDTYQKAVKTYSEVPGDN